MKFEIDVSGSDLFEKDYTIVVAERNTSSKKPMIFGYKFDEEIIKILKAKYGQELYRYKLSKSQRSLFKIRIYCVVIYYILKHIYKINKKLEKNIQLTICKDFDGRENDIKSNLNFLLRKKLSLDIETTFTRLPKESNADKYAYLMRKDKKNLMKKYYVGIKLEDFEKFLK